MRAVEQLFRQVRSLGPYLAIELILPGGSIVALLLWTFRNRPEAREMMGRIAAAPYALWTRVTVALHRKLPRHASRSSLAMDLKLVARS